jgi:hypothetical protein
VIKDVLAIGEVRVHWMVDVKSRSSSWADLFLLSLWYVAEAGVACVDALAGEALCFLKRKRLLRYRRVDLRLTQC